jgi:uncharacterized protein with ParB-like and HNH nuclease domain
MSLIRITDLADPAWTAPTHGCDFDIKRLESGLETWNVDTNPPYQRGHVWTDEQRSSFLGYWLQGGTVPTLWIWEPPHAKEDAGEARPELIDGKQRLTALLMWWHDKIAANVDGRMILASETNKLFRVHHMIHLTFVRLESRADVLRFYLRLNGGGTPHSPEELARVQTLLEAEESAVR